MDAPLPIFKLQIDASEESDLEVSYIALVDRPAIEKNFMAFAEKMRFTINEDRQIISGPAMLAEVPIYRRDEDHGEFMVIFDAPTIYQIVEKFFTKGFNQNFNIMHNPGDKPQGVVVFESFIVDKSRGIQPMAGFDDAKDGSWFISAKVNNPALWAEIKAGDVRGFSVEGLFSYKKTTMSEEAIFNQIRKLLESVEL